MEMLRKACYTKKENRLFENLIDMNTGERMMNVICFHNPDEENGYLSNWYHSQFTVDEIKFSSLEQFMMYRKALCFHDNTVAKQILETEDVARIAIIMMIMCGMVYARLQYMRACLKNFLRIMILKRN